MAPGNDDVLIDEGEALYFNGIDARTGSYLFDPMTTADLAQVARGRTIERRQSDRAHLAELAFRSEQRTTGAHFGTAEGIRADRLEEAGWGVIFPAVAAGSVEEKAQQAIYEALTPLLTKYAIDHYIETGSKAGMGTLVL